MIYIDYYNNISECILCDEEHGCTCETIEVYVKELFTFMEDVKDAEKFVDPQDPRYQTYQITKKPLTELLKIKFPNAKNFVFYPLVSMLK